MHGPLFWNTFTLEKITPNWLSWEEKDIYFFKAKLGTKTPPTKLFISSHIAAGIQQG